MTILIATGVYPPDIGGPATYSSLLAREFPKRGHEVRIVTYGPSGVSRRIPKGLRHLVYFCVCIWKGAGANVIFAQDPVSAGLPSVLAAKILGKRFMVRVAGDYAWEQARQRFGVSDTIDDFQEKTYGWRVELFRKIQRFVVRRADQVITPSDYFRTVVAGWIGSYDTVTRIYNGIDFSEHSAGKPYHERDNILLTVGRLVPWKGFRELIETMPELPDWKLIIVGDGPDRTALHELVAKHSLSNRVELAGSVPRHTLFDYFSRARIFILNTSFESFSFQVVEAMRFQVPVITTNVGNLSEIVTHNEHGILLEPNDTRALIKAIRAIDTDEAFRNALVANAFQKSDVFSIAKTLDNVESVMTSL